MEFEWATNTNFLLYCTWCSFYIYIFQAKHSEDILSHSPSISGSAGILLVKVNVWNNGTKSDLMNFICHESHNVLLHCYVRSSHIHPVGQERERKEKLVLILELRILEMLMTHRLSVDGWVALSNSHAVWDFPLVAQRWRHHVSNYHCHYHHIDVFIDILTHTHTHTSYEISLMHIKNFRFSTQIAKSMGNGLSVISFAAAPLVVGSSLNFSDNCMLRRLGRHVIAHLMRWHKFTANGSFLSFSACLSHIIHRCELVFYHSVNSISRTLCLCVCMCMSIHNIWLVMHGFRLYVMAFFSFEKHFNASIWHKWNDKRDL